MKFQFSRIASGLVVAGALCASLGLGVGGVAVAAEKPVQLVVGATPVPHADLLRVAEPLLAKEGIKLKVVEFSDYVQPNLALANKELDANFFQHVPYQEDFAKSHNLQLKDIGGIELEPIGAYSKKVKDLKDLPKKGVVGIPNDPTNSGRALALLEKAGVIKLRAGAGVTATPNDIVENPKKLKFLEIEAAQLPSSLPDLDAAVINSNYALGAGINPVRDAIALEGKDSPYVNVVTVRKGEEKNPNYVKLVKALQSPEVKKFIESKYQGAIVPAF